jgi:hypothetical protein
MRKRCGGSAVEKTRCGSYARKALMERTNARDAVQAAAAAAGGGGGARPDLTLFTTFSPVFFFSRVIKSGVSVGGARVGRGARRGESRW